MNIFEKRKKMITETLSIIRINKYPTSELRSKGYSLPYIADIMRELEEKDFIRIEKLEWLEEAEDRHFLTFLGERYLQSLVDL